MDLVVKPTKIHESSSASASSTNAKKNNVDLKSYFEQLAVDKGVRNFNLVSDHALCPRYNVTRISAPPVINGATRKFLSFQDDDAAPSYPERRRSSASGVDVTRRANGSFMRWSAPSSTSTNSLLETVLDEDDSILYEDDDEDDDYNDQEDNTIISDDAYSIDSQQIEQQQQDPPKVSPAFHRFSVMERSAETLSPRSNDARPSFTARQQQQRVAPRLPVRQESVKDFSSALINLDNNKSSMSSYRQNSSSSLESPMRVQSSVCVPIGETETLESSEPPQSPFSPQAQSWQPSPSRPSTTDMRVSMVDPPPLAESDSSTFEPLLSTRQQQALEVAPCYGRRQRSSRRSSLDTGMTFRESFSLSEGDNGPTSSSSRWDVGISMVSPPSLPETESSTSTVVEAPPSPRQQQPPLEVAPRYGRRRRTSRRSSLDTGMTFRESFSLSEGDNGATSSQSRWDN